MKAIRLFFVALASISIVPLISAQEISCFPDEVAYASWGSGKGMIIEKLAGDKDFITPVAGFDESGWLYLNPSLLLRGTS